MQRFKNILLVTSSNDHKETALQRAVILAGHNQAGLTVMDVLDRVPDKRPRQIGKVWDDQLLGMIIKERLNELQGMMGSFSEKIQMEAKVVCGTTFVEIIKVVLAGGYDLVIKTSQSPGGLKEMFFGSTDMHLLRKCPCPVWIMKPGEGIKYHRILAAVDIEPTDHDEQLAALNQQIVEMAASLAFSEFSELHIVHAWLIFGENILKSSLFEYQKEDVANWMEDQRADILASHKAFKVGLEKMLGREGLEYLDPRIYMIRGDAHEVIPKIAAEKEVDLVVMGTLARTGLPGIFMGNTAESILNQLNCAVLAIKPPGFVTPVTI